MLTYIQVHLYYVFPPILLLLLIYHPLLGRRDGLKILWLCFMATLYTTPWDNWIISQSGWGYPEGSILGRIGYIPIEEHLFFIVQPIFLVLLHSLITHGRLIPFRIPPTPTKPSIRARSVSEPQEEKDTCDVSTIRHGSQTLPRRPLASLFWLASFVVGLGLVNEAHGLLPGVIPGVFRAGGRAFYLGWILVWISPVIGWLTWLGANLGRQDWTAWTMGSFRLCVVDTISIRAGAWSISPGSSLCTEVVRGLPVEEFIFFLLTSYLVILSSSLISHLHVLLLLSPSLPPCPPINPISHISLLARVALDPPPIDHELLLAMSEAELTLRKGSKSFEVAKLAFGREMRIGLVAVYAWCRVTDNLIDESHDTQQSKYNTLTAIRAHLQETYTVYPAQPSSTILQAIPNLTTEARSAFHLFASIMPRLAPIEPFLELCKGYETDMGFLSPSPLMDIRSRLSDPAFDIDKHLPIRTRTDLMVYADDVAGSIASAICYLAWSTLTSPSDPGHRLRPINSIQWSTELHAGHAPIVTPDEVIHIRTVQKAREMGRALQLVNISRDIAKDALIGRIYVPVSSFPTAKALLDVLLPGNTAPDYAEYNLPLLDVADSLRRSSEAATGDLPRTARGGTRAMSASYFEIASAVRDNKGLVTAQGVKVKKYRRIAAAARAFWGGL